MLRLQFMVLVSFLLQSRSFLLKPRAVYNSLSNLHIATHPFTSRSMTKLKANQISKLQETIRKSVNIDEKFRGYFSKSRPGEYGEHDKFLGVTNPAIRAIAKENKDKTTKELQILLESEYNEERFLALVILTEQYKKSDPVQAEAVLFGEHEACKQLESGGYFSSLDRWTAPTRQEARHTDRARAIQCSLGATHRHGFHVDVYPEQRSRMDL